MVDWVITAAPGSKGECIAVTEEASGPANVEF